MRSIPSISSIRFILSILSIRSIFSIRPILSIVSISSILSTPSPAQVASELAAGDSFYTAVRPDFALRHYRTALERDGMNYAALWKSARSLVDLANVVPGEGDRAREVRDSLLLEARALAERAVRVNPQDANGHFMVAYAAGQLALTHGGKERVRYGRLVYDEAAKTLALDPTHDGAHHVLGAWHAEAKRLSGISRFVARTLFGADFLARASWDSATAHLERAVSLRPTHIYHRLELARLYRDLGRESAARAQLDTLLTLPVQNVMDPEYRRMAKEERRRAR